MSTENKTKNKKLIDLAGKKFNMLTVIERYPTNSCNGNSRWICRCDCGRLTVADSYQLRKGLTKSCGCYKHTPGVWKRQKNVYDMSGEYGVGYASNNGAKFIFDKDDYERIRDYTWYQNDQGYMMAYVNGGHIIQHRYVMCCSDDRIIDHINNNRTDNRKSNLRYTTKQLNGINRGANKNNNTGVKGVSYVEKHNHYAARIMVDGTNIHIGVYDTLAEAKYAREQKELEIFGEYAQKEQVDINE